jgi:hypothetical protein
MLRRWRQNWTLALQGPEGLVLMLPKLLVRQTVISHEGVGMAVDDAGHPRMPLHISILSRILVRIDGQPERLNIVNCHFLSWLTVGWVLG